MSRAILSLLIVNLADLTPFQQSAFGRYARTCMTTQAIMLRVLGTAVTHTGAWYRQPALIPLGLALVLLGWLRGLIWPRSRRTG